jgi:sulfite reductase alpha subunit-like flavoprotein
MRAFLEDRIARGAASNTALYFGCRSAKADLYYAEEWEAMRQRGAMIEVAASRDQESKIYVQDLIKRDKVLIQEWIENRRGHVYISGSVGPIHCHSRFFADLYSSSNAMPKEVRAAIAWCLTSEGAGRLTMDEAEAFVEEMFEDGRGGEESW